MSSLSSEPQEIRVYLLKRSDEVKVVMTDEHNFELDYAASLSEMEFTGMCLRRSNSNSSDALFHLDRTVFYTSRRVGEEGVHYTVGGLKVTPAWSFKQDLLPQIAELVTAQETDLERIDDNYSPDLDALTDQINVLTQRRSVLLQQRDELKQGVDRRSSRSLQNLLLEALSVKESPK